LLYVELQVRTYAVDGLRLPESLEVEAAGRHGVSNPATPPVFGIEVADERAAAQHSGLETASFLVVEGDDPERTPQRSAFMPERADHLECGEDTQRAVVLPSARHGVEVGADQDGRALPFLPAAENVAGGIDLGLQPELLEAADEPLVRLRQLGRPGEAGNAAAVRADSRGFLEIRRERRHRASSATGRARWLR
jgi:hypothetical protein